MRNRRRVYTLALAVAVTFNVAAHAWGPGGHMAVAAVAYDRLTPPVRARVDALVRLNPRFNRWNGMIPRGTPAATRRKMLFMLASLWPDQIKDGADGHRSDGPNNGNRPPTDGTADRNTGYDDLALHKYWHFIDLPFSQDGTALQDPPVPNALTQINAFRSVLASGSRDELKSYDLVWLLHMVGDVHQPLHCAARFTRTQPEGDDGGNGVSVCNPQCTPRRSLHSFWDGLLGTAEDPRAALALAQGLPAAPVGAASNLNTEDWIEEGFELAKTRVYVPPIRRGTGPFRITTAYRNSARAVARRRAALGGARLANILNEALRGQ
jgi:hypothetical protein